MKFRKNIQIRFLIVCAVLVMMAQSAVQTVSAEKGGNASGYTYTITLYAGKEGTFSGGGNEKKISGLAYGDVVSLQSYLSAVKVKDADKYYVRGIRESGKDNNTVSNPAFKVDCDREYVVAYGIKGNMTKYTVHYKDKKGKKLLPSETFYGVVDDQAVVAFQYVDGYRPQAYNLAKTLSSDETKNVFTFTYEKTDRTSGRDDQKNNGTDTDTSTDADTTAEDSTVILDDGTTIDDLVDITDETDTADAANTPVKKAPAAAKLDKNNGENEAGSQTDAGTGDDTEEPKDLVNLDGGRTPLENLKFLQETMGNFFYVLIALIVAAFLLLLLLLIRKKKEKEEREQEEKRE